MVVLEGGGMLSSNGNQYLQPDYLSPLPTTLDAKKSPLALLAQTCSQIGADSPPSKPLISPLDKPKKTSSSTSTSSSSSGSDVSRSSPASAREKIEKSVTRCSPSEPKLAFKPYENNVITTSSSRRNGGGGGVSSEESRPSSKSGGHSDDEPHKKPGTPSRKSASPSHAASTPAPQDNGKSTPDRKTSTPRGASPIIRSGLEMLQGTTKDTGMSAYKPLAGFGGPLSALCCPPGLEHTNPAFRPPFPGAPFSHHHAAMLAASGYPTGAAPGPFLNYARVKTPSGGEALVPVCKDPYCTGCQFSMHNQQLLMSGAAAAAAAAAAGGPCPSGCTQCDHQKYNLAMAMSLMPPNAVPSSMAYSQLGRPYICNWIAGEAYCGKRFVTSEELLQHLRTHTNGSDANAAAAAAAAAAVATTSAASSLLNAHSLFSTSALHRYPNPPLSPLSAARYHPYAKPGVPGTLAASPYSAFNPTTLGQYYSPYSIYGQRLGAAVHQ